MSVALAALQGAVFGLLAMRLAGSESLRLALYGVVAFPLLSLLLSTKWPRLAAILGLVLIGLWTMTCGAMAYKDPSLHGWEWTAGFAFLGLLFGAAANSYLFGGTETLRWEELTDAPHRRSRQPGPRHSAAEPGPPSPPVALDPWAILGVSPGASPRDIRRAFHARIIEYHPDKVATLGVELRELAEAKSKAITEAYAALHGR